jgi:hypothetical protein
VMSKGTTAEIIGTRFRSECKFRFDVEYGADNPTVRLYLWSPYNPRDEFGDRTDIYFFEKAAIKQLAQSLLDMIELDNEPCGRRGITED